MLWMDRQLQFTASTRLEHRAAVEKILFTFKGPLTNSICYIRTPNQPSQAAVVFFLQPCHHQRGEIDFHVLLVCTRTAAQIIIILIKFLQKIDLSSCSQLADLSAANLSPLSLPLCHLRVDFLILSKYNITQIASPFDEPFEDYYWK